MQEKRGNGACSVCKQTSPTTFCCCLNQPVLLCDACVGPHYNKYRGNYHEILPIETLDFFQIPSYRENLRKRQHFQNEAIDKLKLNLKTIEGWKREMCETADYMIAQLTEFRSAVEREMTDLLHAVETDIDAGIQEFKEKFFEPQSDSHCAIAKALRDYDSGSIDLLCCRSDFEDMRKSFDGFLFSISAFVQSALDDYAPEGTIKVWDDIDHDRKVNVYQRATANFCTAGNKAALAKFGEFSPLKDTTFTIERGPIIFDNGVYIGEWNQQDEYHGFGEYRWNDGTTYTGQWKNGQFSGKGRYIHPDGEMYEGDYFAHKKNGFGRYFWSTGDEYVGEFVNEKMHGTGLYEYGDKSGPVLYYIGQFADDSFGGRGAEFGTDGPVFVGTFKTWKRHGKGMMYESGQCWAGQFVEGNKPCA